MPFNALILEEKEKAIYVASLPEPYNPPASRFSDYRKFWIPRKAIRSIKPCTIIDNKPLITKSGKPVVRIYYRIWADDMIYNAYLEAF